MSGRSPEQAARNTRRAFERRITAEYEAKCAELGLSTSSFSHAAAERRGATFVRMPHIRKIDQ